MVAQPGAASLGSIVHRTPFIANIMSDSLIEVEELSSTERGDGGFGSTGS